MKRVPKIGERFGKLLVTGRQGRKRQMLCHCDCGNERIISVGDLQNGKLKSCGRCARADVIAPGTRFGVLTVEWAPYGGVDGAYGMASCRCDCGMVRDVRVVALRSGHTKSCGCLKRTAKSEDRVLRKLHDLVHRCQSGSPMLHPDWWHYANFRAWALANGWTPTKRLVRIDETKRFGPNNCRLE